MYKMFPSVSIYGQQKYIANEESSKKILTALENNKLDYGDKTITIKWYNHTKNTKTLLEKHSINKKFL